MKKPGMNTSNNNELHEDCLLPKCNLCKGIGQINFNFRRNGEELHNNQWVKTKEKRKMNQGADITVLVIKK